jgi:DNA polymerase elongation subunit (family B)
MRKEEMDDMFDLLCPEAYEREQEEIRKKKEVEAFEDLIRLAKKMGINSEYPAYSASHFQMHDFSMAEEITQEGKKNLQEVVDKMKSLV